MSDHPELDAYVPDDGAGDRRQRRLRSIMKIAALSVLVALLLPTLVQVFALGQQQANAACLQFAQRASGDVVAYEASFEFFGPGVIGWECYGHSTAGERAHLASLGLLPSGPGEEAPPIIGA